MTGAELATVVLGVAGIAGTLVGVVLGAGLEETAAERRRMLDAYQALAALYLETATHMAYAEVERGGGPPAPPLREGIEVDSFRAMAAVGSASRRLRAASDRLAEEMQAAIAAQGSPDAGARQAETTRWRPSVCSATWRRRRSASAGGHLGAA